MLKKIELERDKSAKALPPKIKDMGMGSPTPCAVLLASLTELDGKDLHSQ